MPVEVLTGTLRPVAEPAGRRAVREATALLAAVRYRAWRTYLRAAAEQASRR